MAGLSYSELVMPFSSRNTHAAIDDALRLMRNV